MDTNSDTNSEGNSDSMSDDYYKQKTNKSLKQPKQSPKVQTQKKKKVKADYKWIVTVAISSFVITIVLSLMSNEVLNGLNTIVALFVLFFFIFLGVVFDIIGLAFATCEEKSFHAMAARKIESAKYAIKLIRNAEKVSSFCNDVIGDIAGIVSGSTASAIAIRLFAERENITGNLIITAVVAAMTVGLKALGKSLAISHNTAIVNMISKIIHFFNNFTIFSNGKAKREEYREREKEKKKK